MNSITPKDFSKIKNDADVFLLDVRTQEEWNIVNIGGHLIPMAEIDDRIDEIPQDKKIVVLCHHGIRSAQTVSFLLTKDFSKVQNLSGGIDRYAVEVDKDLQKY